MKTSKTKVAGLLFSILTTSALCADEVVRRIPEDEAKKAVVTKVTPDYPVMARQMKLAGRVQVDAYVDVDGKVEKVQIISGNPLLSSAVVAAMKQWKFSPFITDGKPTRAIAVFSFNFVP